MLRCPLCYVLGGARSRILWFVCTALFSPNLCLCDGWGKCLCIVYCHQGASRMRGSIAALALHTFYRATLLCLYTTLVSWYILLCVYFAKCTLLRAPALMLVTSTCRLISGDEITWHSFCACEHHGARTRFQHALELEVDKTSVSLTQRKSEFEKWIRASRPAIVKAALGLFSCAKLFLDARNGQSVTAGFTSSNWSSLCVTTIRTIMASSMIVSFAFLVLSFVIWLLMCTSRLQIWHLSR